MRSVASAAGSAGAGAAASSRARRFTRAGIPPERAWRRSAWSPSKRARSSPGTRARARRAARYSATSASLIGRSRRTSASRRPKAARSVSLGSPSTASTRRSAPPKLRARLARPRAEAAPRAPASSIGSTSVAPRPAARSAPATTRRRRSRPASAPREPSARPRRSAKGKGAGRDVEHVVVAAQAVGEHAEGEGLADSRRSVERDGEGPRGEGRRRGLRGLPPSPPAGRRRTGRGPARRRPRPYRPGTCSSRVSRTPSCHKPLGYTRWVASRETRCRGPGARRAFPPGIFAGAPLGCFP